MASSGSVRATSLGVDQMSCCCGADKLNWWLATKMGATPGAQDNARLYGERRAMRAVPQDL
jgi:hypothetical protein